MHKYLVNSPRYVNFCNVGIFSNLKAQKTFVRRPESTKHFDAALQMPEIWLIEIFITFELWPRFLGQGQGHRQWHFCTSPSRDSISPSWADIVTPLSVITIKRKCYSCVSRLSRCPPNAAPLKFDQKPSDTAFSAVVFWNSINGDRKWLMSSHSVWLKSRSAWMSVQNLLPAGHVLRTFCNT